MLVGIKPLPRPRPPKVLFDTNTRPPTHKITEYILDFKLQPILNVVLLWGDSPASEFYSPSFRNTVLHVSRWCKEEYTHTAYEDGSVPKRRHIKFRRRGIT